jgi:ketosteroid isomerase-like protein
MACITVSRPTEITAGYSVRRIHLLSVLVATVTLTGICGCAEEVIDTRAADEQAIRTAEIEAVVAFNAGDIDGYMASYSLHSMWLPPNAPMVRGAQAIRELATQLAANPGFDFDVQLDTVEVALTGDLAYLVGFYQLTLNDANGNPATDYGKFVEVWKKQHDNTWGHQLAIWNSDGPPP